MKKILFICVGNVMRSQMAEGFYNHFTHSHSAVSAGVDPLMPQQFSHAHPQAIEIMKEQGIDISHQTCKVVTPSMVDQADSIFVMAPATACPDFLHSSKTSFWLIKDPFGCPIDEVRGIRDIVKAHVQAILP